MKSIHVDPTRQIVRAEGGATIGDLDHETEAFGLAVPQDEDYPAGEMRYYWKSQYISGLSLGTTTPGWLN